MAGIAKCLLFAGIHQCRYSSHS